MVKRKDWPVYKPYEIEPKWQTIWEETGIYRTSESRTDPKFYCLDFFPYPSGDGLHVGHCRNYIPTDVISRYMRMKGYNVLHPMGWDAFGEPAEQYAIEYGIHPRVTTDKNTGNYRRQMQMIGTSYDWSREIDSSNPDFYRWTQYFFLVLYERGLAYRDTNWQWWCPTCKTTLSSQEIDGDTCWRGHSGVTKKEIPAWYFRITNYADELLESLDYIDWPDSIKLMQRNWIGKTKGYEIIFRTEDNVEVPVFTTRPDTIYGVTFFTLAPEHKLVDHITTPQYWSGVQSYKTISTGKSEIERMHAEREKFGVFTGAYVINPVNRERVPVWIADYVMPNYGSGAVMGVPAHDQRDFEFAQKYNLPIRFVVEPTNGLGEGDERAYTGDGVLVNSGLFSGLDTTSGVEKISNYLIDHNIGEPVVNYRMRDWLISRQRYWGTPIPIVYCESCGEVPLPMEQLPLLLPDIDNLNPDASGRSPLARVDEFVNTECPKCNSVARRETDTMGGFACSSWYFLRFTSPDYQIGPYDKSIMEYWMPVDLYVGGAEHAVLHLLYSRFWTKALADAGLVSFREPFLKLLNQGQLIAPDGQRMSKSRGNVITPDEMVKSYGADALRIYELFMAPFEQDINWNPDGISGAQRFLNRVWKLISNTYYETKVSEKVDHELERIQQKTIRTVSERTEDFRFNTMISALMEYVNILSSRYRDQKWMTFTFHQSLNTLIVLLAPVAPHLSEELWQLTDHPGSVHEQNWPDWVEDLTIENEVEIAVQINGKLRGIINVTFEASEEMIVQKAIELESVKKHLMDQTVKKIYFIPGKVINIVTN